MARKISKSKIGDNGIVKSFECYWEEFENRCKGSQWYYLGRAAAGGLIARFVSFWTVKHAIFSRCLFDLAIRLILSRKNHRIRQLKFSVVKFVLPYIIR